MTKLTAQAALDFTNLADAQISPDGDLVAFVVADSFVVDTKFPKSNIWVVPTSGGESRQLTRSQGADSTPRWSPDGKMLAFLSDRLEDGQRQVYAISRDGGEAERLTNLSGSIPSPRSLDPLAWSPDGKHIAFLMTDPETDEEEERKSDKNDAIEFEQHPKFTRIYVLDVETRGVTYASPDNLHVWEFCWSHDGNSFAAVASDLPFEQSWYSNRLVTFTADASDLQTIHQTGRQVAKPVWSPDGSQISFLSSSWSDRGINPGGVFVVTAEGGEARELSADHGASYSFSQWLDSERVVAVVQQDGLVGVSEINVRTGERSNLSLNEIGIVDGSTSLSIDSSGKAALIREDESDQMNVWTFGRSGEWSRMTDFGDESDFGNGQVEDVRWTGADGWKMQGLVIKPKGTTDPLPMITIVHGGPTQMVSHRYWPAYRFTGLLVAEGFAVFVPNYRGSTGKGIEFSESNIGDMGGKDWEDIQTGIDHCIKQGIADPERLGIGGGSYGGFITAWAVGQTDRFKAGVMIAGVSDWRSFHGRSYLSDWDSLYYGGADPWELDGLYKKFSPITYVKNVKTPVLITHGELDWDVPVEQGYIFYRALKDLGVETELVVYPREPHGLVERNHIIDHNERIIRWFKERV